MRYLSPVHFFDGTIPSPSDKKAIQLGRKKLLAELELSGGEQVQVRDIVLTKSDIIHYFEDLQQDASAYYHQVVAGDTVLLAFLETAVLEDGAHFLDEPLYSDDSFIRWISPYFLESFSAFSEACITGQHVEGLSTLLDNPLLITPYDEEGAWSSITKLLESGLGRLDYYHRQIPLKGAFISVTIDAVSPLMSPGYLGMIALLPEGRFGLLRDKYAFKVMEASIFAFNRNVADRKAAMSWIENALPVAVSPDVEKALSEKLKEMKKLQDKRQKRKIFRGIWVAVVILSIFRSFHDEENTMTDYSPSVNVTSQGVMDSLLKKGVRPVVREGGDTVTKIIAPSGRLPDSLSARDSIGHGGALK